MKTQILVHLVDPSGTEDSAKLTSERSLHEDALRKRNKGIKSTLECRERAQDSHCPNYI